MPNEVGEAAPRRNGAFQGGISDPLMGATPKPSIPPNSGGRNFYPPQAPKPPVPPKFGGDPGFKGPSERLKPQAPKNKPGLPKPSVTAKPLPYEGPVGGSKQKPQPYTGPIGGTIKNLGSEA